MPVITIPACAYMLSMFPENLDGRASSGSTGVIATLEAGLALPSFWTAGEVTAVFAAANAIWMREAEINFAPVTVSERSIVVPANGDDMWHALINRATPMPGHGIGVSFVYDLPDSEGGWGAGRTAAISGEKATSGIAGFGGNLLAHELGHVLMDDINHMMAEGVSSNLMYGHRNPRVANAGQLNARQVARARERAAALAAGGF